LARFQQAISLHTCIAILGKPMGVQLGRDAPIGMKERAVTARNDPLFHGKSTIGLSLVISISWNVPSLTLRALPIITKGKDGSGPSLRSTTVISAHTSLNSR